MRKCFIVILSAVFFVAELPASVVTIYEGNSSGTRLCTGLFSRVVSDEFFSAASTHGSSFGVGAEVQVANSQGFVYETYRKLLKQKRQTNTVSENFINEIVKSDKIVPPEQLAYIIAKNETNDSFEGVLRMVHGGFKLMKGHSYPPPVQHLNKFKLPMEYKVPSLVGRLSPYKIEIGRLATAENPYRLATALEMMTSAASYLFNGAQFEKIEPYLFYVETDRVRSVLYRSLGFKIKFKPEDLGVSDSYVLEMSARDLYENKVRFLEKALEVFHPINRQGDPALALDLVDKAIANAPDKVRKLWIPAIKLRIACLLELGRYNEVIHEADNLIKINHADFFARNKRVEAQVRKIYGFSSDALNANAAIAIIDKEILSRKLMKHQDALRLLKIRILICEKKFDAVRAEKKLLWDYFPENDSIHFQGFVDSEKYMTEAGKTFTEDDFDRIEKPADDVNRSLILVAAYHYHKALFLQKKGLNMSAIREAEIATGLEPENQMYQSFLHSLQK